LTVGSEPISCRHDLREQRVWRIGYDLFAETRHLLTKGQPSRHAQAPTLEMHIEVVRRLLQESAVPFVEVPARPADYQFTCCLTHDLDFFGIRRHRFDRTLAGFVARASVGTLVGWLRRRRPIADVFRNWKALCSLPFVHVGMQPDFWQPLDDYVHADDGRRATFFVIPFKGRPGTGPDDRVDATRAVPYEAREVRDELQRAAAHGSEIALHGIDAWRDADRGRAELEQVRGVTGQANAGVRMHWLYFSDESPNKLENAGFDYDSTWGYNDAVGYRPGTSQVFRLPGTRNLMELPLSIMDTALLFPDRLNLPPDEASHRCRQIVANAQRFGGTLVINWHDRSLAPERLWGRSYQSLLREISRDSGAWFATAGEAVAWFRWRRSVKFGVDSSARVTVTSDARDSGLPKARVCAYSQKCDGNSIDEMLFGGDAPLTIDLARVGLN
jgi:hypothetical protein